MGDYLTPYDEPHRLSWATETPKSSHPCEGSACAIPGARRSHPVSPRYAALFLQIVLVSHFVCAWSSTAVLNSPLSTRLNESKNTLIFGVSSVPAPGADSCCQERLAPRPKFAPAIPALPPSLAVGSASRACTRTCVFWRLLTA